MDPTGRLRALPWSSLEGLGPVAATGIARLLAGAPAERVVDRVLRDRPALAAAQRTALVEAIFGVALWRRRLGWHAGAEPAPENAALLLAVLLRDLAGLPGEAAATLASFAGQLPPQRAGPDDLGLRWSFPDWIAACLLRDFGAEADELCAALDLPGPICLRANSLRTTRDGLAARLAAENILTRPGRFSPLALVVEGPRPNILGLRAHRDGLFEVQDEGSQLLGLLVRARPGETVLDLCAGAGGKTLLLGGELAVPDQEGALHAHDVDPGRLDRLERRAARAGLTGLRVHRGELPHQLRFDAILVDAPCSELGALRRGPDARFRLSETAAAALPALQRSLLDRAARLLLPEGRILYATCTLRREENEDVVAAFLEDHRSFALRPATWPGLSDELQRGSFFTSLPHRHGTDGFFAARLELT